MLFSSAKEFLIALAGFLLFLNLHSSFAQERVTYPHAVFWHKTEFNEIFENKWGFGLDFIYRTKNELNQGSMFDAHLRTSIRPWVNYQVSKNARLSFAPLGYMYTTEYVGKPEDLSRLPYHELRTTFQFFHHYKHLNNRLMHTWRYRYEMRWQENPNTEQYRYFNRFRFRYRLRAMLTNSDFYENKVIYFAGSAELGLNFGKNVYLNTFNQNRVYLGIGYRFLNAIRAEVRYVDRIRTRGATGFEFDHDRGLMIGIYIDQLSNIGKRSFRPVKYVD